MLNCEQLKVLTFQKAENFNFWKHKLEKAETVSSYNFKFFKGNKSARI